MARECVRAEVCAYFVQYFRIFRTKNAILGSDCGFRADFSEITHKNRTRTVAGRFTQQKAASSRKGPSPADSHSKRPPLHEAALLNTCFRVISVIQKRIDLGIYNCDCEIVEKDRELAVFVAEGIACVKVSLGSQGVLDAERVANLQKRACIRLKC